MRMLIAVFVLITFPVGTLLTAAGIGPSEAVMADEPATSPHTTAKTPTDAPNDEKSQSASSAEASGTVTQNRLARESSPYLLLHAHNPMDWYPWGPEAFEKAKSEGKPIFLSIGYSSCYWCHVMEREAFSNPRIAAFMNQNFVNIKVDREERPDVDDIYMTCLIVYQQAARIGGGGGWPLSMFLTPDGNPVAGATYLPPEDTDDGRTGFLTAATRVHTLWEENPESLQQSAAMIAGEVRRLSGPGVVLETAELTPELVEASVQGVRGFYDPVHGGVDFRPARPDGPRFPNVPRLQLLLLQAVDSADPRPDLLKIVEHSLTAMAEGGIRDHLAGGFHRYSTDRRWHVPHFEKMLYDQAQLLEIYSQAAVLTGNQEFVQVASELADFVLRELRLPDGGFCSALDAETNAIEGEYYVWSKEEVEAVLGSDDAQFLMQVYGMQNPNPFEHGFVLHLPQPLTKIAEELKISRQDVESRLQPLKQKLLAARSTRQRPLLDDKVLTEWNAMMIQALAESGKLPGREGDLQAAARAAEFLLQNLRDTEGHLLRSWRNGQAVYRAYLDDYAFLASALLRLHQATGEQKWLTRAVTLTDQQIRLFYDPQQTTFFYTSHDHEKLIARSSSAYDSTFPSGNSVTVRNLLTISHLLLQATDPSVDRAAEFTEIANKTLLRFSAVLKNSPAACSGMAIALQQWLSTVDQQHGDKVSLSAPADARTRVHDISDFRTTAFRPLPSSGPVQEVTTDREATDPDSEPVNTQAFFKPVFPATPAAGKTFAQEQKSERPVQVKIYPLFDKLERGGTCPVAVELTISNAWHINANPANPDFLVPTELKISSKQKIRMTKIKYPEHELLKVQGVNEPYHVYGNRILIYGLLETDAAETAAAGELEIRIRYQACNETTCMPPDEVIMKGKLPLANPGDPIRKIHEDKFPKPKETPAAPTGSGR